MRRHKAFSLACLRHSNIFKERDNPKITKHCKKPTEPLGGWESFQIAEKHSGVCTFPNWAPRYRAAYFLEKKKKTVSVGTDPLPFRIW